MVATKVRVQEMVRENFADVRATLAELPDARWDEPVLCEGWRVRDLVGHLVAGTTIPIPRLMAKVAAGGFRVDGVVKRESIKIGDRPIATLRQQFNEESSADRPGGFARLLSNENLLADWVTHYLDILVPLDIDAELPEERLAAALDILPTVNTFKSKKRAKGLRLVATDIDWSAGSGPEVHAPAAALILTLGGRPHLASELEGEGADVLRRRVSA